MTEPRRYRNAQLLRLPKRRLGALACRASEACLEAMGWPAPAALRITGHMRSGSTLLLHLLLTNRGVSALGERNATYGTPGELGPNIGQGKVCRTNGHESHAATEDDLGRATQAYLRCREILAPLSL